MPRMTKFRHTQFTTSRSNEFGPSSIYQRLLRPLIKTKSTKPSPWVATGRSLYLSFTTYKEVETEVEHNADCWCQLRGLRSSCAHGRAFILIGSRHTRAGTVESAYGWHPWVPFLQLPSCTGFETILFGLVTFFVQLRFYKCKPWNRNPDLEGWWKWSRWDLDPSQNGREAQHKVRKKQNL